MGLLSRYGLPGELFLAVAEAPDTGLLNRRWNRLTDPRLVHRWRRMEAVLGLGACAVPQAEQEGEDEDGGRRRGDAARQIPCCRNCALASAVGRRYTRYPMQQLMTTIRRFSGAMCRCRSTEGP